MLPGLQPDADYLLTNVEILKMTTVPKTLAIIGADTSPSFSGLPDAQPDLKAARDAAARIDKAIAELERVAPSGGSYVSESDFFEPDWQRSFWGANYSALARIKRKYDPDGLFFVHHGVGSESWDADGFVRVET